MWDSTEILRVEDIAQYLGTSVRCIQQVIDAGEIPSFDVAGEPRVLAEALIGWIQSEMHAKNLEILKRTFWDEAKWRSLVESDLTVKEQLR